MVGRTSQAGLSTRKAAAGCNPFSLHQTSLEINDSSLKSLFAPETGENPAGRVAKLTLESMTAATSPKWEPRNSKVVCLTKEKTGITECFL